MTQFAYTPLKTLMEFRQIEDKAHKRFKDEIMGERPTLKHIKDKSPERVDITIIVSGMVLMAILLYTFVGIKGGIASIAYVDQLVAKLSQGLIVPEIILHTLYINGIALYSLMPVMSVVYSKVVHDSPEKVDERKKLVTARKVMTWRRKRASIALLFDFEYLNAHIYRWITLAGLIWVAQISWVESPNGIWEYILLWLLPLTLEFISAFTFAKLIAQVRDYNQLMRSRLAPAQEEYDVKLHSYREHPAYYRLMLEELREALRDISKGGVFSRTYPNRIFLDDPNRIDDANEILLHEYARWHMDSGASERAQNVHTEQTVKETVSNLEWDVDADNRIVPPANENAWTLRTMKENLALRGIELRKDKENSVFYHNGTVYNEGKLREDYAPAKNARNVFRRIRKGH